MILLDTNVMSEPLRAVPDARVVAWIDGQPLETLFLSAITVAELRAGVALLPAGKRRTGLQQSCVVRLRHACRQIDFAAHQRRGNAIDAHTMLGHFHRERL